MSFEENIENFRRLPQAQRLRTIGISVTFQTEANGMITTQHALLSQDEKPSTSEQLLILRLVLLFRQIAFKGLPDSLLCPESGFNLRTWDELLRFAVGFASSLLMQILVVLCTGRLSSMTLSATDPSGSQEMTRFLSIFLIFNMVVKVGVNKYRQNLTPVQVYLTNFMEVYGVPENAWRLFHRFGLVGEKTALKKRRASEVLAVKSSLYNTGGIRLFLCIMDLVILLHDQVGFKVKNAASSKSAAYKNVSQAMYKVCRFPQLVATGLYDASWVRDESRARYVGFSPSLCDFKKIGERVRHYILAVIHTLRDSLPPKAQLKQLLVRENNARRTFHAKVPCAPHASAAPIISSAPPSSPPTTPVENDDVGDLDNEFQRIDLADGTFVIVGAHQHEIISGAGQEEEGKTDSPSREEATDMYTANGIEVDPIQDGDISNKTFLKTLMMSVHDSVQFNLQHGKLPECSEDLGDDNYCLSEDHTQVLRKDQGNRPVLPVQKHCGSLVVSDGSPAGLFRHMQESGEIPAEMRSFVGGFHTLKEFITLFCKVFSRLLEAIVGEWRDTDGKMKWFLEPSDPRQFEDEAMQLLLAHYAVAVHAACEFYQTTAISEEQVEQFMLSRAKEHAVAFEALLSIRFLEAIFMMQESERYGGEEDFFAARKFLTLLASVTNARNYMNINTWDDLMFACSSEAERIIFREFIFVQKTRRGSFIFSDRFVENTVMHIRQREGKIWHEGKMSSLEATSVNLVKNFHSRILGSRGLNDLARMDHNRKVHDEANQQHDSIDLSDIFICAYLRIEECQIWSASGPPREVGNSAKQVLPHCNIYNEPYNPDFFSLLSIAEERTFNYGQAFCCDPQSSHYRAKVRSEEVAPIATVPTLFSKVQEDEHAKFKASIEIRPDMIAKSRLYSLAECRLELNDYQLSRRFLDDLPEPDKVNKMPKKELANHLSRARIARFNSEGGIPAYVPRTPDTVNIHQMLRDGVQHPMLDLGLAGCTTPSEAERNAIYSLPI